MKMDKSGKLGATTREKYLKTGKIRDVDKILNGLQHY